MKHISILVPKGSQILSSVVGAYKVFNAVNGYFAHKDPNSPPPFKVDLVGLQAETEIYGGTFAIRPTKLIADVEKTDLIIVTTIMGDLEHELKHNADFIPWIKDQRIQNNAEVASLCVGAFLLAETGLLNGKSCATHWMFHDLFRLRYPQINLIPEKVIIEDNGIYSSGGSYSFLNLLLYLVEKYTGRESAIYCSKLFEIDIDRKDQSQFIIFRGQKDHLDEPIKKAQEFIESNFKEKLRVDELAEISAISRRNFVRRFKKATANTPLEYIQRVKVEVAKKNLESTTQSINEVMYGVGYNDDKAFRKTFKKYTGLSPLEYRGKYNRELV